MIPESEYERQRAERAGILLTKQADEIESLRRQLAECQQELEQEKGWHKTDGMAIVAVAYRQLEQERDWLRERLHKCDGMAHEINLLVDEITKLEQERDRLRGLAKRILPTLELAMDVSLKYEPCGYYCDEAVGHVDHKLFNWARECKGEIEQALTGAGE